MKNKLLITFSSFYFFVFSITNAELELPVAQGASFWKILMNILEAALKLLVPIAVLLLVYVGFLFIKATGKENELSKAKEALINVLIGIAIIFISYWIFKVVYAKMG